jgi:hypothetical protein
MSLARPALPKRLGLIAVVGLLAALAALLLGGAPPAEVKAAGDSLHQGAVFKTIDADGVVTTTTTPEQLGTWIGYIAPTWSYSPDTPGSDAAYDGVATGLRTLYTVATVWNGASYDLQLAKFVDGVRTWERSYDGPAGGYDRGQAIAARGSAIYTVGRRDPAGADTGDLLVNRWDASGNLVWTRTYDSGARLHDEAVDVALDGDGNVNVIGYSRTPATSDDWVLVSYKADGARRYVRRLDGPAHLDDRPVKMAVDSAGNVYMIGAGASATNGWDALVAKYSKAGARLWMRRYNGSANGSDEALSLRLRPGGGVYVCGHTMSVATNQDGLLLAYNAAGTRLFAALSAGTGGTTPQAFNDLEVLSDGRIICGGYDSFTGTLDRFQAVFYATGTSQGAGGAGTAAYNEQIQALAKDVQGGVYLSGTWGTATGPQIWTSRRRDGGSEWDSDWPATPAAGFEVSALAVKGVNVYVIGSNSGSDGWDQTVLGYVY